MAKTQDEAIAAVEDMLEGDAFGSSGKEIVIEETLYGEEASIHVIVSGEDFVCLPPSQDHKRADEGDTGLNTGGMGAYTPTSRVTSHTGRDRRKSDQTYLAGSKPTHRLPRHALRGLCLRIRASVLEYNVRFGDPETQVLLPMVADDLARAISLRKGRITREASPTKVRPSSSLAAGGYPGSYAKGDPITFPNSLPASPQSFMRERLAKPTAPSAPLEAAYSA